MTQLSISGVTVEFGAFEFTGPLVGFGPNYSIRRGALTGPTQQDGDVTRSGRWAGGRWWDAASAGGREPVGWSGGR